MGAIEQVIIAAAAVLLAISLIANALDRRDAKHQRVARSMADVNAYGGVAAMPIGRFWAVVASAHGNPDVLTSALARMTAEQIVAFQRRFDELHSDLFRHDLWGAAFVARDGCGDDSFDYIRAGIIGHGQAAYEMARFDPDGFFAGVVLRGEGIENERFLSAAGDAYHEVAGEELHLRHPRMRHPSEPAGETWDESDLGDRFPLTSSAVNDAVR